MPTFTFSGQPPVQFSKMNQKDLLKKCQKPWMDEELASSNQVFNLKIDSSKPDLEKVLPTNLNQHFQSAYKSWIKQPRSPDPSRKPLDLKDLRPTTSADQYGNLYLLPSDLGTSVSIEKLCQLHPDVSLDEITNFLCHLDLNNPDSNYSFSDIFLKLQEMNHFKDLFENQEFKEKFWTKQKSLKSFNNDLGEMEEIIDLTKSPEKNAEQIKIFLTENKQTYAIKNYFNLLKKKFTNYFYTSKSIKRNDMLVTSDDLPAFYNNKPKDLSLEKMKGVTSKIFSIDLTTKANSSSFNNLMSLNNQLAVQHYMRAPQLKLRKDYLAHLTKNQVENPILETQILAIDTHLQSPKLIRHLNENITIEKVLSHPFLLSNHVSSHPLCQPNKYHIIYYNSKDPILSLEKQLILCEDLYLDKTDLQRTLEFDQLLKQLTKWYL